MAELTRDPSRKHMNRPGLRLAIAIMLAVALVVGLCVTSYALVTLTVLVPDNYFTTGSVEINLNDGKPIINTEEYRFEPGMTVEKSFFVENRSSCPVYYRLYMDRVTGSLATVLQITIRDGDTVLYQGTAAEMGKNHMAAVEDALDTGERRVLTMTFHFPSSQGNGAQGKNLSFTLEAEAVQTANNPDKQFS